MKANELISWLLTIGIADDLSLLVRVNALQDLENVKPVEALDQAMKGVDWGRLLLAGSILARSEDREPREAALLIATSAMTAAEPGPVRDSAALLFEQLSNQLAVKLAQKKEGNRLRPGRAFRGGGTPRTHSQPAEELHRSRV